ncbi:MAG: AAA family ATPase [Alphaproteobacteria bacterium]|nr:AAA family ATPase [Alphaproteobacteria bacterium]NNF25016.1 AAA family ATPase [Paracoccaceae bacterium]
MATSPDAQPQDEVVAFLSDPATHGTTDPVEVIGTHCAIVFLAGDRAYKIKRPVKYDYLDFSTLARRHAVLERELSLNLPAAPMIYQSVVPITRAPSGSLALDGTGPPAEYALVMRRFSTEAELSSIADAGLLTEEIARELGRSVASYHEAAPRSRSGEGAILIREIIDELGRVYSGMTDALGAKAIAGFGSGASSQLERHSALLDRRAGAGRVRRCHGDLHLKNLVMLEGRPVPFDALEFDERLGTCDVYYDLAFLLMDLWHRKLHAQANATLNSYIFATGDIEGLAALPLFLAIRSAIRAMVDVQTWRLTGEDALARAARCYLSDAAAFLEPAPARLVAVGGLSGSGKTTVAHRLAPAIGAIPGALHLRSDLERKALFDVDALKRLPQSAYSKGAGQRTYERLFGKAETALAAGHSVILDATFLLAEHREAARAVAEKAGVPFTPLWLSAPPDTLLDRVRSRAPDASDATEDVVRAQIARAPDADGWPKVDAAGDLATTLGAARAHLQSHKALP